MKKKAVSSTLTFASSACRPGLTDPSSPRAEAGIGGRRLGFAVELNATWKATPIGDSNGFFYWGSGSVRSIGVESDVLLATLAELYEVSVGSRPMRAETRVAVVGLADDPRLLAEKPTHMKLFFESEDSQRYAEVYVNVIAPERRLELHEKDPAYREPLLRALGEGAR